MERGGKPGGGDGGEGEGGGGGEGPEGGGGGGEEDLKEGLGACGVSEAGVGRLGGSATGTAQDPAHLGCVEGRAQCQVTAL